VYGASFSQLSTGDLSNIRLVPTVVPTHLELALCRQAMMDLSPIPPHFFNEKDKKNQYTTLLSTYVRNPVTNIVPDYTMVTLINNANAICLKKLPDDNEFWDATHMAQCYLSFNDAYYNDIIDGLKMLAKSEDVKGLYLYSEFFSISSFGIMVQVFLY
jgi:hypothetical protein